MKKTIKIQSVFFNKVQFDICILSGILELLENNILEVRKLCELFNIEKTEDTLDAIISKLNSEILPIVQGNKRYPNGLSVDRANLVIVFDTKVLCKTEPIEYTMEIKTLDKKEAPKEKESPVVVKKRRSKKSLNSTD